MGTPIILFEVLKYSNCISTCEELPVSCRDVLRLASARSFSSLGSKS